MNDFGVLRGGGGILGAGPLDGGALRGGEDVIGEVPDDVVRVLRGDPDEDELAALVAGIVATHAGAEIEDDGAPASAWTSHAHRLGVAAHPSRSAWRWSAHRAR